MALSPTAEYTNVRVIFFCVCFYQFGAGVNTSMCTSLFSICWEKGARECKLHVRHPLGYNGRRVLPTNVLFYFIFTASNSLYISEVINFA